MSRLLHAWAALSRERRVAAVAALALLVTMFFPWYGLQSVDPKTKAIYSHNISAFGDVSFVEAAIFLVAAGVIALLLARAEEREFSMPGGDGTIVAVAGGWATLLIFYRVFDRPSGHGYPVGIEWGFFLAFVAAGSLAYAGLRMRPAERPPPRRRSRHPREEPSMSPAEHAHRAASGAFGEEPETYVEQPAPRQAPRPDPTQETALIPGRGTAAAARSERRPRYPPRPGGGGEPEQLSFEEGEPSG
jgi:hypothetical protein